MLTRTNAVMSYMRVRRAVMDMELSRCANLEMRRDIRSRYKADIERVSQQIIARGDA